MLLDGRDIRSYQPEERAQKDRLHPAGAVPVHRHDPRQHRLRQRAIPALLRTSRSSSCWTERNLDGLLARFEQGLETKVDRQRRRASAWARSSSSPSCAPCCAIRRLLILDEATANIDTVTEQLLEEILDKLPASTTKVIIAHRLNTIANADEIFFVNAGDITPAGSMEHALDMLLHGKRAS